MTKDTVSGVSDDWTIPVSEDGLLFMVGDVDLRVHDVASHGGWRNLDSRGEGRTPDGRNGVVFAACDASAHRLDLNQTTAISNDRDG